MWVCGCSFLKLDKKNSSHYDDYDIMVCDWEGWIEAFDK